MKNWWILALLLCWVTGCGESGDDKGKSKKDSNKGSSSGSQAKTRRPALPAPVPSDAYPDIPTAVDALCKAAESNQGKEILLACGWLELQGSDAVQPLGELLLNPSTPQKTRYHACRALGQLGDPAVPLLIKSLDTESVELRIGVLNGLGRVRSTNVATNDRITRALLDRAAKSETSMDTRRFALRAIAALGEPAESVAKQPLLTMLHDTEDDSAIKGEVRRALKAIAPRRTLVD